MALGDGLEHGGAQRGRQRQRKEAGEEDRDGHHQRELAIDIACCAGERSQWQEHGHQNHGNANHGALNLAHGLDGGVLGRQAFFGHDAFDVFHDHDGIVHDDTNHQHHGEHGQNVDGQAGHQHHGKGAKQRDRHHDRGNQGVADVLQEDQHHDEHQHNGFNQRVHHLFDGNLHELGGVVGRRPLHAARQEGLHLGHLGLDQLGRCHGVGGRSQLYSHSHGGLAVQAGLEGVAFDTQLDACHILQAHG